MFSARALFRSARSASPCWAVRPVTASRAASSRPSPGARRPSACRWSASLRRPRRGSAGWYNNRAFEIEAEKIGRSPVTLEGDAFSNELKKTFIDRVREKFGQLDMLVYSMAAPVRTDPDTGKTYRSAIKPLGAPVEIKTLNTETGEVYETTIAPASEDEAAATVAVMGGDDWKRWIDQLADAGVLAPGFRTLNYTYIGSELTWPIYWKGTLGRAKVDLDRKAEAIRGRLGQDAARVVALKAVVTQASSAIPVVPLYGTVLFKVMKQLGLHEGCIEQIDRLFRTRLGRMSKSTRRSAFGSTTGSFRPKFRRRCRDDGRCSPRKRSANWPTFRNTGANSFACSDLASTASTTRRTWTPRRRVSRLGKPLLLCMGLFSRFCVRATFTPPRSSPRAGTPDAPRSGRYRRRTTAAAAPS